MGAEWDIASSVIAYAGCNLFAEKQMKPDDINPFV
jgi:hypothetical protein